MLSELPLTELLERLAARTAAPGGGSAAAAGCAVAAALVEMAGRYGTGEQAQAAAARAAVLRTEAVALIDRDAHAFAPVLEAARRDRADAQRPAALAGARSQAAEPPLAVARIGAELAGLGEALADGGNPNLTGDAVSAVLLAEAACLAATALVVLNLEGVPEDERRARAERFAVDAGSARARTLTALQGSGGAV